MDILAHGLWTAAAAKAANKRLEIKNLRQTQGKPRLLNVYWAAFWGIFPDLFAFTIPFVWITGGLLFGNLHISDIPRPHETEPPAANTFWSLHLAKSLYNVSHSGIVFGVAFLIVWIILRRPVWEMGGWLLHILIDIPTHSYRFYPTPVFWPISIWKFLHGFSWSTAWFMILNYSALLAVYLLLWRRKKNNQTY